MSGEMAADPLAELYRDRYGAMVRLAYLLTGDTAAAEDLVQVGHHGTVWYVAGSPPTRSSCDRTARGPAPASRWCPRSAARSRAE